MTLKENEIEQKLIEKLQELKYTYRPYIHDRATLEQNFRKKFEMLNHVVLTDAEFARLRDEIINADVFQAAKNLREYGYFQREDGTTLHYMLVNLKDWCKNDFEVINNLHINTDYSHHRYDVILLINGVPVVQIELKRRGINSRKPEIAFAKNYFSVQIRKQKLIEDRMRLQARLEARDRILSGVALII